MSYEYTEGYQIRNQGATYYLTFAIEGWIDLFSRKIYKDLLLESFDFCRKNKNLQIHAYVFMSNHVHTIWTAKDNNLSDIIRDFKTYTSKSFIKIINETAESRREWLLHMFHFYARQTVANKNYKIWTNDNHPVEIISPDFRPCWCYHLQVLNFRPCWCYHLQVLILSDVGDNTNIGEKLAQE